MPQSVEGYVNRCGAPGICTVAKRFWDTTPEEVAMMMQVNVIGWCDTVHVRARVLR